MAIAAHESHINDDIPVYCIVITITIILYL